MVTLDRDEARRIAVRAQLLDAYPPPSRLGAGYAPSDLTFALERERSLVEYASFVRPMADIGGRHGRQRLWDLAERVYHADRATPATRQGSQA